MGSQSNHNPEFQNKKSIISESVDNLIQKKKAERQTEGESVIQQSAEGIQTEVAEVMVGVEKPKEKVSEKKGESGEKGDISGGSSVSGDDGQSIQSGMGDFTLPSEEIMISKVRSAIQSQIKMEWKKAKKLQGGLITGGAQEYNSVIAHIRSLKEIMTSLFSATFSFVKSLYLKYFTPDGKRRPMEDVQ